MQNEPTVVLVPRALSGLERIVIRAAPAVHVGRSSRCDVRLHELPGIELPVMPEESSEEFA